MTLSDHHDNDILVFSYVYQKYFPLIAKSYSE